jgi:hypothetical protein
MPNYSYKEYGGVVTPMPPATKPKAKVDLSINCGCGYRTDKLAEAIEHASAADHQLAIAGSIVPPRKQL